VLSGIISVLVVSSLGTAPRARSQTDLQVYLDHLTHGRRGSAIVANPSTGEILAAWNLTAATNSAYPPGSTAKIVEAAALLEENLLSPRDRIVCRRIPPLLGAPYHCVHPQAREGFTLDSALANSCNYFFAAASQRLDAPTLAHWYSVFGFGQALQVDWTAGGAGRVAVPADARGKALAAIGERDIVATPAQLLEAYSLIADAGEALPLWTARTNGNDFRPSRRVQFHAQTLAVLKEGLVECVESGTCQAAAVPGVRVAGKTGTATALDGSGATHAWFVGFAPADHPKIELVVFLERGTGAHTAAPMAGAILRRYFASRKP
jgi:penicillin-binding protein A